ncbi:hypothetical protein CSKR_107106 [Clonorchis sinensis]|uniref:Uncharacterized protein n=1 Tax=Clonorchis sinensis TaxID=79923 RepID=A0A419Q0F6_CLOSI|nr:hypothetical protein CSKR_107106 [Clonorchis sinensis]
MDRFKCWNSSVSSLYQLIDDVLSQVVGIQIDILITECHQKEARVLGRCQLRKPRQAKSRSRGRVRTTDLPCITHIHASRYLECRCNWNMRRPGAAHSFAWKHHNRDIQLGFRKLLTGLLKTLRQPTTGFALLGAHQEQLKLCGLDGSQFSSPLSLPYKGICFKWKINLTKPLWLADELSEDSSVDLRAACQRDAVSSTLYQMNQQQIRLKNITKERFRSNSFEIPVDLEPTMLMVTSDGIEPCSLVGERWFKLGQPGSIPALVLPPGVGHWKGVTDERFFSHLSPKTQHICISAFFWCDT